MAPRIKSAKEKKDEQQLRLLVGVFARYGITIRREKLSRGSSFRVKSGDCSLSGTPHVFVDRRLPAAQQLSLLIDYLVDFSISLDESEVREFSAQTLGLLNSKGLIRTGPVQDEARIEEQKAASHG